MGIAGDSDETPRGVEIGISRLLQYAAWTMADLRCGTKRPEEYWLTAHAMDFRA